MSQQWTYNSTPKYIPKRHENITNTKAYLNVQKAKSRKRQCPPTDEWMNKMWYILTTDDCLAIKRMKP